MKYMRFCVLLMMSIELLHKERYFEIVKPKILQSRLVGLQHRQ